VRRPDGTEAGLLGGILRTGLDLYANVRPIRSRAGVAARVVPEGDGIDYVIVRENTEGMYAARGLGVGNDWAVADTMLITRPGSERIARFAFELARRRAAASGRPPTVTCVDKANVLRSMFFFRQIVREVGAEYPEVALEVLHVDAAAEALVVDPERFDVIVTENLFGDILSDLGGGTIGGIALCPGGNIGAGNAYFEPIHGSAPSIAGTAAVNPVGQVLAGAMMLEHLGETEAAAAIDRAVDAALGDGSITLDRRGGAGVGAAAVGRLIAERL
jgi:isocitrate/isopropylmalate dehydrogenase